MKRADPWETLAGSPGRRCLMLKHPKHLLTAGDITGGVLPELSINRCIITTDLHPFSIIFVMADKVLLMWVHFVGIVPDL